MKKAFVFCFLLCLFLFSSCSDYNELNMQAIVRYAGVDFSGGETEVSVMCEGAKEDGYAIYSGRGKSFFEAVRNIAQREEKKLYWGHTEALVFGEEAIKNNFDETLDAILRARDVYLDIVPVAAREMRASYVINAEADGKTVLSTFANEANSRRFSEKAIWEILRLRDEFFVCIIPTLQESDGKIIMSGGACISKKTLLGFLDGEEMLLLSLLTEDRPGGYLPTLETEEGAGISFEILSNKTEMKKENDTLSIRQKITLSPAEVSGDVTVGEMKKTASRYLSEGYEKLFSSARKENLGNIFATDGYDEIKRTEAETDVQISNVFGG